MKTTLAFFSLLVSMSAFAQGGIKFIVNANNPASSITQTQLQDFFLKRARTWPNGEAIRFFDRVDDSSVRNIFLKTYMKRTARQLEQYWIGQKLYSGDSAPTQLSSDAQVGTLVSRFPGGIGYVSSEFTGPGGVKTIQVVGD